MNVLRINNLVIISETVGFCVGQNFLSRIKQNLHFTSYISNDQMITQSAITCSKLTIETLEQGVKYVQS